MVQVAGISSATSTVIAVVAQSQGGFPARTSSPQSEHRPAGRPPPCRWAGLSNQSHSVPMRARARRRTPLGGSGADQSPRCQCRQREEHSNASTRIQMSFQDFMVLSSSLDVDGYWIPLFFHGPSPRTPIYPRAVPRHRRSIPPIGVARQPWPRKIALKMASVFVTSVNNVKYGEI